MNLLSLGIVWGGYLLVYYGITTFRGPGVGLVDLASPWPQGRVQSTLTKIQQQSTNISAQQGDVGQNPGYIPPPSGKYGPSPTIPELTGPV